MDSKKQNIKNFGELHGCREDLPVIQHGDRRMISEIWPELICGCGRKVRYISVNRNNRNNACNKYCRCISWDELKAKYDELWEASLAFADEPMDRNTYTLDHKKRKRLLDVLFQ